MRSKVDVFDTGIDEAQFGAGKAVGQAPISTTDDFAVEHQPKPLVPGQIACAVLTGNVAQRSSHAGKPQGLHLIERWVRQKFRRQLEDGSMPQNFLRHFYDVCCLLGDPDVQAFIGTEAYVAHKDARFPAADNKGIAENPAFDLSDQTTRDRFARAYAATSALYYRGQPNLDDILGRIQEYARGGHWDQRVAMMQHWSDYLHSLREAATWPRPMPVIHGKAKPAAGAPARTPPQPSATVSHFPGRSESAWRAWLVPFLPNRDFCERGRN